MKYLKYTDSFNSDYWAVYRWDEESKYGYLECCHHQNNWTTVAIFDKGPPILFSIYSRRRSGFTKVGGFVKYVKYIDKYDPNNWVIYCFNTNFKRGYFVCGNPMDIWLTTIRIDKVSTVWYDIKYLTQAEVDLIKLELL